VIKGSAIAFVGPSKIGHKQDDESGLIYMRARYYEPASGRFISEDVQRIGLNWISFCDDNPIQKVDANGKLPWLADLLIGGLFILLGACLLEGAVGLAAILCIGAIAIGVALIIQGAFQIFGEALENVKAAWNTVTEDKILSEVDQVKQAGTLAEKLTADLIEKAFWLGCDEDHDL